MSRGRSHALWLRQVESYPQDTGLAGRWSDGGLSEGYGHDGPGVCLGDSQTEAERVPAQGGRGDALLRRMPPPDLTCTRYQIFTMYNVGA